MTGDYDNPNSENHLDTTNDTSFVLSVHDNQLLGYMVDGPARRITLRTVYEFPDREPEYTNVVFEGVFVYHFAGDTLNTILFDVEETTLEAVWDGFEAVFTKYKNYGWPPVSYADRDDLLRQLHEKQIKAFGVVSSYGMEGFVWAQSMTMKKATNTDNTSQPR